MLRRFGIRGELRSSFSATPCLIASGTRPSATWNTSAVGFGKLTFIFVIRSTGLAPRSWTTLIPVAFSYATSTLSRMASPHWPPHVIMTIWSVLARASSGRMMGTNRGAANAAPPALSHSLLRMISSLAVNSNGLQNERYCILGGRRWSLLLVVLRYRPAGLLTERLSQFPVPAPVGRYHPTA